MQEATSRGSLDPPVVDACERAKPSRFQLVSNGRRASITRVLAFILFPGIALSLLIPTLFTTDTSMDTTNREAAGYVQPAPALLEDARAPEHQLLDADSLPERAPTTVQTSTPAPTVTSAANIPAIAKAAESSATHRPVTPTIEPLPVAEVVEPLPVTPTVEPLPVALLPEVPLVPTESPAAPHVPIARLVIPSIGVDAAVETRSVDPDGAMQTPGGPAVVSWYDFSSQPQGDGNAVFAGHLDYAGYGPAVFWDLQALAAGDIIEVHQQDGNIVQYRVTDVRPFAAADNASEVVSSNGRPTITLITCDGTFDSNQRAYDQRLVVTGDRVD